QPGGDGLLIIWADEADLGGVDTACSSTDSTGCGGHHLVGPVGPPVKGGLQATQTYPHQSGLRTTMAMPGDTSPVPGAAQNAPDMAEFFKSTSTAPSAKLTVSSPAAGITTASPLHMVASATASSGIDAIKVYVDGTAVYHELDSSIDMMLTVSQGTHQ